MDIIKRFLFISVIVLLAGCSSTKKTETTTTSNDATVQLAQAATTVSHSLSELATVERATIAAPKNYLPNTAYYPGMSNLVSVDWSGPIAPLVKRLADASDYRLHVMGRQPAIPVIVTLYAKNAAIGDILRDAAYQSGHKANIYVIPQRRIIELRYIS